MADTTAAPSGGRALFVRQSSGLVREVSVRNALFYNTAAFIGITVAWAPLFYTLAFEPIGKVGFFTSYGLTAILVGACCVSVLRLPLASVMIAALLSASAGLDVAPLIVIAVVIAYLVSEALTACVDGRIAVTPDSAETTSQRGST